jgi:hypothetical protein
MNQSNFNVTVNGETVSIPLAKARELCPNEVEKMELVWNQASLAIQNQDVNGSIIASKEVEKMMKALVHALALKLQQEHQKQERG